MKPMQKVSRGAGFGGAVRYAQAGGELIGGNMSGLMSADFSREFGVVHRIRPDVKRPVWHQALRLPRGEKVSKENWREIAADYMKRMGFSELHQHAIFLHDDPDGQHIHIVASRVALDSSLWHGQNENLISTQVVHQLEKIHGLRVSEMPEKAVKKDRKSLTRQEINMAVRTEMKPPRVVCQEAIDEVLQSKCVMSAPEFIHRLEAFGVRAVPSVASTGTMNGFSFEAEGVAFTGSKLGESFKWAQLQKRGIEYVKDRDFAALADARASARERAAAGPDAGRDLGEAGLDSAPGPKLGAVAELGSRPGERVLESAGPDLVDAARSSDGAGSVRPSEPGTAPELGRDGPGTEQPGGPLDGAENSIIDSDAGIRDREHPGATAWAESQHGLDGRSSDQDSKSPGPADNGLELLSDGLESPGGAAGERGQHAENGNGPGENTAQVESLGGVDDSGSSVRAAGAGWSSRFKQNSARQRAAGAGPEASAAGATSPMGRESVGQGVGRREKVTESDRVEARTIDPAAYLKTQGFDVRQEGRHLSVRVHGDEVYRCTRKEDGHWVTCDRFENGIGDNIALVQELEPGLGFAESVYRLSGAPSVASATRPAPAPVVRQPPKMPAQDAQDVKRGRAYLARRGISSKTIEQAERAGMLRYSAGGVLFVGRDEHGTAQNIMRRAVDASEGVQKRDLSGTDKRHPQMLLGASEAVLIVEGGVDALAAHDLARRQGRPAPTVLVSGGANVRSWIETPWVQKVLQLAKKIIVAFECEAKAEVQAKTDAAHQVQIDKLREMCGGAEVVGWKPPEGINDMAALNEQRQAVAEASAPRATREHALRVQERLQQLRESPDQDLDRDRNQGMSM